MKFFILFISGILFGSGLTISGMTDPARVLGFLDVTGHWDPTLAFVMAGALGTYAASMAVRRKLAAGHGWFGSILPRAESGSISKKLIFGALTFGVGWGLSGFCPGPALANLAALRIEALIFVPAMVLGMIIARRIFHADSDQ